ncbi:aminotransferase class V-fold PLP-dependent enzyme [Xanthomonas sp. WHRI 10064A]|uniref:aminotransferase class V-fold PLP-dependent enzyme n=1 Tax=unclassified Xanthomonas TaxID=2643310 RepID=UPI002B22471F|nr:MULTISPECIES: aminotransferase class V-fold PLP-dependent enzyme [unclassified Xanthomonas]MEA9589198.1 aminotransferase class V-fold PLP-dependent enzyme [Xanthomonas sp. WHRI 10064B]MEA9616879.1 aminotransferase class V-fold PLP-dependent enzyme [Xanthomonas sp. WHRI 10064A]
MSTYLDCNASSPIEPVVLELVVDWLGRPGNAASRTHEYGVEAQRAVQLARDQVAAVIGCQRSEVIFTSGATEANNLALLGLYEEGLRTGRKHVVTTAIEHKAVLEPIRWLEERGFVATYLSPDVGGQICAAQVLAAVRPDTLLVSVMHANNETGVVLPIAAIADGLAGCETYLHTDAAQGFGKDLPALQHPRLDLISISGHKIYAPQGIGALIARRRQWKRPPLAPLAYGGGHEQGLRPGTLPVALIAGLGLAAEMAVSDQVRRRQINLRYRAQAKEALGELDAQYPFESGPTLPHVLSLRIPGIDSEALMLALRGTAALSNGSACNSQAYEASHVLAATGMREPDLDEMIRISWSHLTPSVDWAQFVLALSPLAHPRKNA